MNNVIYATGLVVLSAIFFYIFNPNYNYKLITNNCHKSIYINTISSYFTVACSNNITNGISKDISYLNYFKPNENNDQLSLPNIKTFIVNNTTQDWDQDYEFFLNILLKILRVGFNMEFQETSTNSSSINLNNIDDIINTYSDFRDYPENANLLIIENGFNQLLGKCEIGRNINLKEDHNFPANGPDKYIWIVNSPQFFQTNYVDPFLIIHESLHNFNNEFIQEKDITHWDCQFNIMFKGIDTLSKRLSIDLVDIINNISFNENHGDCACPSLNGTCNYCGFGDKNFLFPDNFGDKKAECNDLQTYASFRKIEESLPDNPDNINNYTKSNKYSLSDKKYKEIILKVAKGKLKKADIFEGRFDVDNLRMNSYINYSINHHINKINSTESQDSISQYISDLQNSPKLVNLIRSKITNVYMKGKF